MPRKIRHTLTKKNGGWILQKVFVPRSCHFLTFNRYSVGVFEQTICSKRGRTTPKNTQTSLSRFCNSKFNKKTESVVTFSIELAQNYNNLPLWRFVFRYTYLLCTLILYRLIDVPGCYVEEEIKIAIIISIVRPSAISMCSYLYVLISLCITTPLLNQTIHSVE